jgi:hypothetical protein
MIKLSKVLSNPILLKERKKGKEERKVKRKEGNK